MFPSKDALYFIHGRSCHLLPRSSHSTLSSLPEILCCSSSQVSSHFSSLCCLNPFSLIRFLSRSNRSGFRVYLIPVAFDSHHSRRSFSSRVLSILWFPLAFLFLFQFSPNRSGFEFSLIPWAFASCLIQHSSFLLECSWLCSSSLFCSYFTSSLFPSVSVLRSRDEISC